ncbi:MAG: hypothetical protein ABI641_01745 [Caldimonas sp.]
MSIVRTAAVFTATLFVSSAGAQAQSPPVYRCGNTYSSTPCADGKVVDADDPRTPEQRAAAAAIARDERHLGNAMSRERRRTEAARRPAAAASLGPTRPAATASAASASLKPKKKAKGKIRVVDGDDFTASVPRPVKHKTTP